jgi:hypothetical protein
MARRRGKAESKTYRIEVRGEFGDLLTAAISHDFQTSVDPGGGRTVLIASVRDEAELYGLLDRLRDFAVEIVSLHEVMGAKGG